MIPMEMIQSVAMQVVREFQPERIILFGSYARQAATDGSDVDLLVVLGFEGKPFWKSLEILNRISSPFALDLIARRPDDVRQRYALHDPLIREALDHGKVLYERGG